MKNSMKIFPLSIILLFSLLLPASAEVITSHGFSLYSDLKYGPDFKHFDYVNPNAPKGGTFVKMTGDFNNLNMYAAQSSSASGAMIFIAETLLAMSFDEPETGYGLIAETISYPEDYSWVEIKIRDIARWHDGKPITVDDVLYTYELLTTKSTPAFKTTYSRISSVEQTGPYTVRFAFPKGTGSRNLIWRSIAMFPVFPKHYWETHDFTKATLEPPLASGPYKITKIDIGNSITQERVKDYWGRDIPVNKGRWNFDVIRYDVYRDAAIAYESFMAGNIDLFNEGDLSRWTSGYDNDAARKGYIKKMEFVPEGSVMFMGIGFNLRKDKFKDQRVREALAYAFDWEWVNKNIYYGKYKRSRSYFANTELENKGLPEGAELKLLGPFRKQLDPRVFTQPFELPKTDATQAGMRKNLRQASILLKQAGWNIKNGKLVNEKGEQFKISMMMYGSSQEAMYARFFDNLRLLGFDAKMEIYEGTAFWPKYWANEWDIVQNGLFPHSLSPGAELRDSWGSKAADMSPSFNSNAIKDPIVDALIEKVVEAKDRPSLLAACRALDRVMCWKYYSVPLYYFNTGMLAYWDRFGMPGKLPQWSKYNPEDTLWIDKEKDAATKNVRASGR